MFINSFFYFLLLIIYIVIAAVVSTWFTEIAKLKGYDVKEKHIWARCFWLGFIGWLYAIGLPDKNTKCSSEDKNDLIQNKPVQDSENLIDYVKEVSKTNNNHEEVDVNRIQEFYFSKIIDRTMDRNLEKKIRALYIKDTDYYIFSDNNTFDVETKKYVIRYMLDELSGLINFEKNINKN